MLDVVVLYCSDKDRQWNNDFERAKRQEERFKNIKLTDGQSVGRSRYRDWGMFKYWFRGVEKYCDNWVNNIFLVVARESQIPEWLNLKHPKLKVVYHHEFIPSDLLPTFNTNTIQFFLSRIENLSEEFLISDDDVFFTDKISKDWFFKNGLPIKDGEVRSVMYMEERGYDKTFASMVNNNTKFLQRYCNFMFRHDHFIKNRLKSYESYLLDKYYDDFFNSLAVSKFRHPNNYTTWLIDDLFRLNRVFVQGNPYINSSYINLNEDSDLSVCNGKNMICLNDTNAVKNFEITKRKVLKYLNSKFPRKSSYEK